VSPSEPVSPDAAAPHVPVLLDEVIAALAVAPGETHVDGTFGAGGYTKAILDKGAARVFAFDRDPEAIQYGEALAASSGGRLALVPERFSRMRQALAARQIDSVDGVTLDIGVSSMQLDRPERGFSFQADGPLDMRMGKEGESAAEFLNRADEDEIADILYHYGEEPKSRRIARAIVAARPIERTGQLAAIVRKAAGYHPGQKKDPATRTFQAIRIHLNEELQELEGGLEAAEQVLKPGGRLAVVTFHSLEDRLVKRFLKTRSGDVPSGSRHMPERPAAAPSPSFSAVARPVRAGEAEIHANPRARSATLRVARRTSASPWNGDASPWKEGKPS
jgi:16S rRNA (cytosine1402-N4)-methyltransferase